MIFKVFFVVYIGSVNEDWDVLKEVSREAKANYTKAGTGDWVHNLNNNLYCCAINLLPCVSSDKLHLIVYGRVASHMLRRTLFRSVPNQKCCVGSLSYYLKLEEIDAVHIPVPINLIFVGFNGEGNQGIAALSII